MLPIQNFPAFIRRIRIGDQQAIEELVRDADPLIRRNVRNRLRYCDQRLAYLFEPRDISQLVLGSFFERAASGHFDLNQPEDLERLFAGMVRRKLASLFRKHSYQRRDVRRLHHWSLAELRAVAGRDDEPGNIIADREFVQESESRLSGEERRLLDLRRQGRSWPQIADSIGGTADGRRKQLKRAAIRVGRQLKFNILNASKRCWVP